MRKKVMSVLTAAAVALALTACGSSSSATTTGSGSAGASSAGSASSASAGSTSSASSGSAGAASSGDVIKIGTIAPNTGSLASFGESATNGANLAVKEINAAGGINGMQIEVTNKDDQSDPTECLNAFNSLVSSGINLIVGSVTSGCTSAITDSANEEEVCLITPSATADTITTEDDYISEPATPIPSRAL